MENIKNRQVQNRLINFFKEIKENDKLILLFIILTGLFMRVYKIGGLDVGGAWDEGYSMIAASNILENNNFLLINHMPDRNGVLIDHPPVLYLIGAVFMKLFGNYEISARAVSILFGVISIYVFFVLINYLCKDRKLALLSAFLFACFPLNIALSRVFMGHVPALCFTITSIYLLTKGVYERKLKLLFIAGILLGIDLLILQWFGILPVIGILIWLFLYTMFTSDRDLKKYYFYAFLFAILGFLIFMLWPLLLSLNEHKYHGFHGGCFLPNCDVWDLILKRNAINRIGINVVGIDITDRNTSPLLLYVDIIKRLSRPYLGQGHFNFSREFDYFYKLFLYFGIFVSLTRLNQSEMKKLNLFWFFWLISYLPIQLGKNLYTQYLILLVPFFSFYIAYGIYSLDMIQLKLFQNKLSLSIITILICFLFLLRAFVMIQYNNEYLYRTNYKIIAEYLRNKTQPSRVICSRYPGMSYYLKGECKRWDSVKEDLGEYIKKNEIEYVDIWRGTRLEALQSIGCEKINNIIELPDDSEHSLYKCGNI